jgi:hypothetical protein
MRDVRWIIALLKAACTMAHHIQSQKIKIYFTLNFNFLHAWKGNIFALGLSYFTLKLKFYQRCQGFF